MGNRREPRTRIALPVKVYIRDAQSRPAVEVACTMDVTPRGARLSGVRKATSPGEVVSVERGKNKALYKVVWVGAPNTLAAGQIGLQSIEPEASIWGIDFLPGQDERYDNPSPKPVAAAARKEAEPDVVESKEVAATVAEPKGPTNTVPERVKRYSCAGTVQIYLDSQSENTEAGELAEISSAGCYVRTAAPPPAQTKIRLQVKLTRYAADFSAKGTVDASDPSKGMWVNFTEMTSKDYSLVQKLLRHLSTA